MYLNKLPAERGGQGRGHVSTRTQAWAPPRRSQQRTSEPRRFSKGMCKMPWAPPGKKGLWER